MTIVGRQKEIGKAIGDELDVQNKLLDDLEGRVDITGARMKGAIQQAKKLS
jgi:regulator of vacuolar morphogenesis